MPAGASEDFLFCTVEIDSLLLLLSKVENLPSKFWPHLLFQRWLALEVRAPLNLVLMTCHSFKKIHTDPLCLPEILLSEYALSWPACTDKSSEPGVKLRPPEPGSHTVQAHCFSATFATVPQGQVSSGRPQLIV